MSKKRLAVLLVIIVIIAGAIGGVVFFLQQSAENTPALSPTSQVSIIDSSYEGRLHI